MLFQFVCSFVDTTNVKVQVQILTLDLEETEYISFIHRIIFMLVNNTTIGI